MVLVQAVHGKIRHLKVMIIVLMIAEALITVAILQATIRGVALIAASAIVVLLVVQIKSQNRNINNWCRAKKKLVHVLTHHI